MQDLFVNKDVEQSYLSTCLIELGQWKQRDAEDNESQTQALEEAKAASLEEDSFNNYFLATQIGQRTWLTDLCQANFDTFLRRAQDYRYNLNVMKLQIEAQRVDLEKLTVKNASLIIGDANNVKFAANAAAIADRDLTVAAGKLPGAAVPAPVAGDDEDRQALLADLAHRKDIYATRATQLGLDFQALPKEPDIKAVEDERSKLAGDLRQRGTESERQAWNDDLNILQARATAMTNKFRSFTQDATALTTRINTLIKEIQAASNPT